MYDFFLNYYANSTTTQIVLEFLAFFFGIISVFYAKKENILVYPTGLIATVISIYLMYHAKYFGDMIINFYYSIMSIYGWHLWSKNKNNIELPISRATFHEKKVGMFLFVLSIIFTYLVYVFFGTKLKIPNYIDIFTSGLFFTAMWLMALKKIENWPLWIIADIIAVPLFAYRGLGMIALQYLIFTLLAISAYIKWNKILAKQI